jgi:transcriptional regulator with XRE-family HTH domain
MTFGTYFRELRENNGKTQKDIADAIGKSIMHVSNIEKDKSGSFKERDLDLIAKLLNLDDNDKESLLKQAALSRRKLPDNIISYIINEEKAYTIVETISRRRLNSQQLDRIQKYVNKIGANNV